MANEKWKDTPVSVTIDYVMAKFSNLDTGPNSIFVASVGSGDGNMPSLVQASRNCPPRVAGQKSAYVLATKLHFLPMVRR